MSKLLIDYTFADTNVANPDGSLSTTIEGASITEGPGTTPLGVFEKALDLGATAKGIVDISGLEIDTKRFCVRFVFQVKNVPSQRQNLVESDRLPFSLHLGAGDQPNTFNLFGSVRPEAHDWRAATTRFKTGLEAGKWYTVDLVYDIDTVGILVDGQVVGVHAFPQGAIELGTGSNLYIGAWVDGSKFHLDGLIAALQLHADIPADLESLVDERRSQAEWFMTYKHEAIRDRLNIGEPTGAIKFEGDVGAYLQYHERGLLMYHDGVGAALEMHGAIYDYYRKLTNKEMLGYLASDEIDSVRAGGRKSLFSRGAIYWSPATGAVPVSGRIYLDYEAIGEASCPIGFPTNAATEIAQGWEQKFQGGRMYFRNGASTAHEVHGAILDRFLATGGTTSWGFPISNEVDVKVGGKVVGKRSDFEVCTFLWSAATGACELHGDIRKKYEEIGGAGSPLGLPTSDEADIPGASGAARYNTFQKGSILWFGSWDSIVVATPFRVFLGRISSKEEEGLGQGQNDIYFHLSVTQGSQTIYSGRHPHEGYVNGRNIIDVNFTIPPVIIPDSPGKDVTINIDIWDYDDGFGGGDDHLGKWSTTLSMANGWRLRERTFSSGAFAKINDIGWSVKPDVDPSGLSEKEKYWGVTNRSTPTVSWQQYAAAFSDIDSETEAWDITDWVQKAFYELVVDTLTDKGNCFGMSLEAIYARKDRSLFGLPLNVFTNWEQVRNEFNIKHCYQVGAGPIWWFVGEFITGNTHDPVDVFNRSLDEFRRGNHPVICVSQNYDFSGKPHCVLPVAWDKSSKPWTMTIADPNVLPTGGTTTLTVDPDENTFRYVGSDEYKGGEWTGGRLHFMPYDILCEPPRTPVWEAVLLILLGTVVILGDDAQTVSLTDPAGNDLDAFGSRAAAALREGGKLHECFVGYKGFDRDRITDVTRGENLGSDRRIGRVIDTGVDLGRLDVMATRGKGTVAGELLLRSRRTKPGMTAPKLFDAGSMVTHLPVGELMAEKALRPLVTELRGKPELLRAAGGRTIHHLARDASFVGELSSAARARLEGLASALREESFDHKVQGVTDGELRYGLKHGLTEVKIDSSIQKGESNEVQVRDPGSSRQTVGYISEREKTMRLQVDSKLGLGADKIRITIEDLPVSSGKDVQVNLKPGLGGIDVMAGGVSVTAPVSIDATIDGRAITRRFNVPIEGGARIKPSTALSENGLTVSRIEHLFGPAADGRMIPGGGS